MARRSHGATRRRVPRQLFVMTDDADIVDDFATVGVSLGVELFTVPPGRQLVSTKAVRADATIGAQNHERNCRDALEDLAAQRNASAKGGKRRGPRPTVCSFDYLRDPATGRAVGHEELLQWLVSFEVMSACDGFVGGTFHSHFTRLMYAWMCARRAQGCPWLRLLFADSGDPIGPPYAACGS